VGRNKKLSLPEQFDNLIYNQMITPDQNFIDNFKKTNGALSVSESIAIMNIASICPNGLFCEIGVYKGKSALSAVYGGEPKEFILVDPEFEKTISTQEVANSIASVAVVPVRLAFIVGYSTDFLKETKEHYAYVMVDSGSHQDGIPMQEAKLLEDRMIKGGVIVWHDWNSQFKEVKEATEYLVGTGKYEYIPIEWDKIVAYVNENELEVGNLSWHHQELSNPCFVGAVTRK
jgi:hypothetical protein